MNRKSAAKISRHKKKYWRKGVNLSDVNSYLDKQRDNDLVVSHWRDATAENGLFVVDKTPNSKLRLAVDRPKPPVEQIKETPNYVKRKVGKIVKSVRKGRAQLDLKRLKTGTYTPPSFYDLWDNASADVQNTASVEEDEFKKYYLKGLKKIGPKVAKTMKILYSTRMHVDLPHPGTSYNPAVDDHSKLIEEVYNKEIEQLNAEEGIRSALQIPEHETPATEETIRQELLHGLLDMDSDNDRLDSDNDRHSLSDNNDDAVKPKAKAIKLKTKAQRRREAAAKRRQLLAAERKKKRILDNEIFRLKSIKKEIRELDERIERKKQRTAERKRQRLKRAARLGPHKFEPVDVELLLPEQLPGSMRLLKNHGNLVFDRYKSFQQRNIIEPRHRVIKKKFRRRITEKEASRTVDANYIPDNPFGI